MLNQKCYLHVTFALLILTVLGAFFAGGGAQARTVEPGTPDWERPEVVGINKEPGHCTLVPYSHLRRALKIDRTQSRLYMSLNGDWKFNWAEKPADRPVEFYKPGYDVYDDPRRL